MASGQFRMARSNLAGVEAVEAWTDHVFPRHTHDQFGIGVVLDGAQKSLSGRGMVEAWPGDIITVNPGEVHDGMPIGDGGRRWRMLYVDPSIIAAARRDISEGRSAGMEFASPVIPGQALADRFLLAFSAMTTRDAVEMRQEETLLLLLADLLCETSDGGDAEPVPAAIARARTRIDDDPTAALTLSDLAHEGDMSRFQLLRGFARATGMTPHAYLIQRRIHLARRLIAAGRPLAIAAIDAGFADQSHLTRAFTQRLGMSPGSYAAAVA